MKNDSQTETEQHAVGKLKSFHNSSKSRIAPTVRVCSKADNFYDIPIDTPSDEDCVMAKVIVTDCEVNGEILYFKSLGFVDVYPALLQGRIHTSFTL